MSNLHTKVYVKTILGIYIYISSLNRAFAEKVITEWNQVSTDPYWGKNNSLSSFRNKKTNFHIRIFWNCNAFSSIYFCFWIAFMNIILSCNFHGINGSQQTLYNKMVKYFYLYCNKSLNIQLLETTQYNYWYPFQSLKNRK